MPPKKRKEDLDTDSPKTQKRKKGDEENGGHDNDDSDGESEPSIKLEGSLISGEMILCGGTNWDLTGRNKVPSGMKNHGGRNLWSAQRVNGFQEKKIRTVVSGCTACHSVIIDDQGKAYTFGRNDKAQLGHGDTKRRDIPTLVDTLSELNIVDAACGRNHTLFLTDAGRVYAAGDNKFGQLGLGHQSPSVPSPTRIVYNGPPIRRMACGGDFSVIVDVKGNVWTFGCPEYGQLGNNTDGQYFVSSNKLQFSCETRPHRIVMYVEKTRDGQVLPVSDVEVVELACGASHTILVDRRKRAYTFGFGGYGRLGHAEQKDEMIPRLIKFFDGSRRGVVQAYCGSAFTMAINEVGCLFLWGQNKPTGEAAMYPKPVQDLSGWNIRSIGCCNRSIVVAADDSVISWGPSPTYGELGYGEHQGKSSTTPKEMKPVGQLHVHKVACGFGHTLLLIRNDSEDDQKALDKMPVYTPENPA